MSHEIVKISVFKTESQRQNFGLPHNPNVENVDKLSFS